VPWLRKANAQVVARRAARLEQLLQDTGTIITLLRSITHRDDFLPRCLTLKRSRAGEGVLQQTLSFGAVAHFGARIRAMPSLRLFASIAALLLALDYNVAGPNLAAVSVAPDEQFAKLPVPPDVEAPSTVTILENSWQTGMLGERAQYLPAIVREAAASGVPPALVDAVVRIESQYQPHRVGRAGEIGLMQVRPKTAAFLGFRGSLAELAEPETNIRFGVSYLAKAWRLADGDLCRTLMKYRAGHSSRKMNASSTRYCRRARLHLAAIGMGPQPEPERDLTASAGRMIEARR
jgi:soluble lytic murein transglycosylase-like protein